MYPLDMQRTYYVYPADIFNGVAPSPQVAFRFQSQFQDPIYGNDMIREAFGTNAKSRHRQFKCFFALQNPCIPTPPRKIFPNWKVRPLLKWINHVGPQCYTPGKSISVDEMTMGFQGRHQDKKRIVPSNLERRGVVQRLPNFRLTLTMDH